MSDMDIHKWLLDRILLTELHVCHLTMVVSYFHRQNRRWYEKKSDQHPVSGRYRFRFGKNRTTVYRNRIVWMYFSRRLIPEGFYVDHVDGDNQNDHPYNLRLMDSKRSHQQGNGVQSDKLLEELGDYFELCGFLGRHPNGWD